MKPYTLMGALLATASLLVVSGCQALKTQEPTSTQHIKLGSSNQDVAPIPSIQPRTPYLPKPKASAVQNLYSLSAIQTPARDVLYKLARDAKLELNMLEDIDSLITINLIDQPLSTIIERLNDQANIRASLQGKILTVQADTPYWQNYPVDFINLDRYATSSILVENSLGETQASSSSISLGKPKEQPETALSIKSGSNVAVLNRSRHEAWKTLGDGIMQIIRSYHPELDQRVAEGQIPTSKKAATAKSALEAKSQKRRAVTSANESDAENADDVALETLENHSILPMDEEIFETASHGSGVYPEGESVSNYVNVAREAGFVSVYATRKVQSEVRKYVDELTKGARRQVMIEATVVEVTLNDESQAGIDWNALRSKGNFSIGVASQMTTTGGASMIINEGKHQRWNINATLNLLQDYGRTQVLSSPKIVGVNNQQTILKVVKNYVYFTVNVTPGQTTNGVTSNPVYSTTPKSVPVGLIMNVLPSIDQHNQVTLVVRPTITTVVGEVQDPNPELSKDDKKQIDNKIPIVEEREMESVLKLSDGQIAVLGGLIKDEIGSNDFGVPGAVKDDDIGWLFGKKANKRVKNELVIFLRPTIINHPSIEEDEFIREREFLQQHTSTEVW